MSLFLKTGTKHTEIATSNRRYFVVFNEIPLPLPRLLETMWLVTSPVNCRWPSLQEAAPSHPDAVLFLTSNTFVGFN